uniref:Hypoxanthine phosphoribosyltransferase n=1 Tax=candidate division WOR-3 bacterium TaxID=2052148 RepID=A0A7C4GHT8_UNCW3
MNRQPVEARVSPLLTAEQIGARVREIADRISHDYAGGGLVVVGILKGAWVFLADLVRCLTIPVVVDFIAVSSYGSGTESSGAVNVMLRPSCPLEGQDVLVVDDILDTGLTLGLVLDKLRQSHPRSLRLCVLLDKPARRRADVEPDYVGFQIPDRFVVGYGLDCGERFRNLPYLGFLAEVE